jgi:hypothetical protein
MRKLLNLNPDSATLTNLEGTTSGIVALFYSEHVRQYTNALEF